MVGTATREGVRAGAGPFGLQRSSESRVDAVESVRRPTAPSPSLFNSPHHSPDPVSPIGIAGLSQPTLNPEEPLST
jgi:hypothetical protein